MSNRPRKACDLCYTRKIKCDGQQPRCSNCINYATDCTHTVLSRKSKPRGQRSSGTKETNEVQGLQAEVQRLKTELAQNQDLHQARNLTRGLEETIRATRIEDQHYDDNEQTVSSMKLPPLQQAMAMIGVFLNTFNAVLPLFHADTLLYLVGECYACQPGQRDPVVWAAINVVFALASQQVPGGASSAYSQDQTDRTTQYLDKARSVISTVMLGETRLLNIQVLVGMVMVLQTAHNLTPSLILISATMRLVHKLGLHNQAGSTHLDPVQRRQHVRVFWLAYIIDKDLSLRTQQPSVQLDDDIDVELPSSLPTTNDDNDNTAGIVITADGNTRLNYFLARIKLANIEGRVYDTLYSTRAMNRSLEERRHAKDSIVSALDEWRASIPPEFSANMVTSSTRNKPARNYMLLFREISSRDAWFRWLVVTSHNEEIVVNSNRMTSCPYTTAMVLLTANTLYNSWHDKIQLDIELIDSALLWLNDAMKENQSKEAQALRETCVEAVQTVKQKLAEGITTSSSNRWLLNYPDNLEPF
ncbi:hypothetical protein APSETT445_006953 [Aspergillus pseudonomiae]